VELKDALAAVVGPEHVDPAGDNHLQDVTENPPGHAEFVVRPKTADEIRALLVLARERSIPVTPVVAGYNVAGLAIPRQGGVVLDLTRMDAIVELDHEAMYVVIEPGVTFAQLKAFLDVEAPELVYTYPFAPPFTSVMMNALLDGLNNLSMPHGAMGKWVNGLEAVLADGEVVRTGSGGVVDRWFSRAPVPDFSGLFVSTQGTTGIVTRIALQLQPKPQHRRRWLAFAEDLESAYGVMRALARTGSFDDCGLMTWPAAKQLFGATRDLQKADDEPFAYLMIDITGASEGELEARVDLGKRLLAEHGIEQRFDADEVARLVPALVKMADLPTSLDFLLDFPGGGLTWVGSYGPGDRWVEGAHAGLELLTEHGFPPFLVARPMDRGHFYVLRFVANFDKGDPDEVERVRTVMGKLADAVLDHDYVPYKPSADAVHRILDRAHPGFVRMLERVRDAFDPDRRMNPGRW
jgi:FAD/FMN-containing dehydrogenase